MRVGVANFEDFNWRQERDGGNLEEGTGSWSATSKSAASALSKFSAMLRLRTTAASWDLERPDPSQSQNLNAFQLNDAGGSSGAVSAVRPLNASGTGVASPTALSATVDATSADVLRDMAPQPPVQFVAECDLPNSFGRFKLRAYRGQGGAEPMVVVAGDVTGDNVMVRLHDQCFTSEVRLFSALSP